MGQLSEDQVLYEHAARELDFMGASPEESDKFVKLVEAFLNVLGTEKTLDHASITFDMLTAVLRNEPIGMLTNNPAEWETLSVSVPDLPHGILRNRRNPQMISYDGGTTCRSLLEEHRVYKTMEYVSPDYRSA